MSDAQRLVAVWRVTHVRPAVRAADDAIRAQFLYVIGHVGVTSPVPLIRAIDNGCLVATRLAYMFDWTRHVIVADPISGKTRTAFGPTARNVSSVTSRKASSSLVDAPRVERIPPLATISNALSDSRASRLTDSQPSRRGWTMSRYAAGSEMPYPDDPESVANASHTFVANSACVGAEFRVRNGDDAGHVREAACLRCGAGAGHDRGIERCPGAAPKLASNNDVEAERAAL